MRNMLLGGISALALMLSGAAFAASEQSTEGADSLEPHTAGDATETGNAGVESLDSGTENQGAATSSSEVESSGTQTQDSNSLESHTEGDATETGNAGVESLDANAYRSYSKARETGAEFQGEIASGYSADELIGRDVENSEGETIGTVADLLIDQKNRVDQVIVDVGGFLGLGAKAVTVDIESLNVNPASDNLMTMMTEDDLRALPEAKETETGWSLTASE